MPSTPSEDAVVLLVYELLRRGSVLTSTFDQIIDTIYDPDGRKPYNAKLHDEAERLVGRLHE